MSDLINNRDNAAIIRWKLLTSVSALALVSSVNVARAEDAGHSLIWIELGGQMESVSGQGEIFAPPFLAANPNSPVLGSVTPLQAQRPPKFDFGENGTISFQPEGSDWLFSAAIRYGRSGHKRHVHHQTLGINTPSRTLADFADTVASHRESHAILDFSAGKDVGLGLFGRESSSVLSVGVRIAQFTSNSAVDMRARPDLSFKYFTYASRKFGIPYFHTYHATGNAARQFRGVGPSIAWNGSVPFAGNQQDGELTFDWAANAGILFGKQSAHVRHQETARYCSRCLGKYNYTTVYHHPSASHPAFGHDTDRSVIVPNVGGSVGLSWRVQDFKFSMGYRADIFFGAMDTGIDAVKKSNTTFNGPYASISVGLGD
jgi:iron complex outermembrane recepter protein